MKRIINSCFLVFSILLCIVHPLKSNGNKVILSFEEKTKDFIKPMIEKFEGVRLKAYKCPSGVPTIGIGSTRYKDGRFVKMGDLITVDEMNDLYEFTIEETKKQLDELIKVDLPEYQEAALISFLYNVGYHNFKKSRLLKKVNIDPNDLDIENEFMKWVFSKGKKLKGLEIRRTEELKLYFT